MTKEDHITYWVSTAATDYKVVFQLFENESYPHCLFFAHLTLEKLLKAIWVKDNEDNFPPKLHNLVYLLKQTHLDLSEEEIEFFSNFNQFQLEGRYPDYHFKVHQRLNKTETTKWIELFKHYHDYLLNKIVSAA